jgi:molecular chaperone HscB
MLISDSGQKNPQDIEYASYWSAWINKAYHTLKDPLHRSLYMLHLHGVEVAEADIAQTQTNNSEEQELLFQVMQRREEIDEADNLTKVEQIQEENHRDAQATEQRLNELFDKLLTLEIANDSLRRNELLSEIRKETVRLKYYRSIHVACQEWAMQ